MNEMREMTADEVTRNGNAREAALMGSWIANGATVTVKMLTTKGATMHMYFCVGDKQQEVGIDQQLQLEHAIRDGLMVRA